MKRAAAWIALAAAPLVAACASLWGFDTVTLGDGGADAADDATTGTGDDSGSSGGDAQGGSSSGSSVDSGRDAPSCGNTTSDALNCGQCGNVCTTTVANAVASCSSGICGFMCKSGYNTCNNACVSFASANNCGSCGHACSADAGTPVCSASGGTYACAASCPMGTALCNGSCVDPTSTATACGTGMMACTVCATTAPHAEPVCVNSACTITCDQGYALCNGACVPLNTSANCGACGVNCAADAATPVCASTDAGTACVASCPGSQVLCGAACVDKQTDPQNCGTCGNVCNTGVANAAPTCNGGMCDFACNSSYTLCSGSCVRTASDPNNCGACGNACSGSTPACSGSTCVGTCPPTAPTVCSGSCVDTTSDPNNCGTCGNKCTTSVTNAQAVCKSSSCTFACNTNYTACNGACVNEQADTNNCGGCGSGHACTNSLVCQGGSCSCSSGSCPSCPTLQNKCCKNSATCGCAFLGLSCN